MILLFGIKNEVDYVAASFVSTKQDVADLRSFFDENGGEDIEIIAKIENRSGVDHVEEICEIANGIMIAREEISVLRFRELRCRQYRSILSTSAVCLVHA